MDVLKMLMINIGCMLRMNVRNDRIALRMIITALCRMNNRRHHVWFTVHEQIPFPKASIYTTKL